MVYISSNSIIEIDERVEAAVCIANNNTSWDGKKLYDIDKHFLMWGTYIKERMKKLYGEKANL